MYAPAVTRRTRLHVAVCLLGLFCTVQALAAGRAIIGLETRVAPMEFAAADIAAALRARQFRVERTEEWRLDEPHRADLVVRFALVSGADDPQFEKLAPEGFLLRNVPLETHRELVVLALDPAGAMYGGLELAEQIRAHGVAGVRDTDRNPYMPLRGNRTRARLFHRLQHSRLRLSSE